MEGRIFWGGGAHTGIGGAVLNGRLLHNGRYRGHVSVTSLEISQCIRDCILADFYDMIYLLTANGLSSRGSTHLHTNNTWNNTTNNRTTQLK